MQRAASPIRPTQNIDGLVDKEIGTDMGAGAARETPVSATAGEEENGDKTGKEDEKTMDDGPEEDIEETSSSQTSHMTLGSRRHVREQSMTCYTCHSEHGAKTVYKAREKTDII